MEFTFRALTVWPAGPTRSRRRAAFKSTWLATMDLLDREVAQLGARRAVVELDCDASEIRRDGLPRADARVRGPGVILSFGSRHGPVRFPCDTYHDWQDNARAIGLAMAALRAVDRYGVTKKGEQYQGWQALPANVDDRPLTRSDAARVISAEAGLPRENAAAMLEDELLCRQSIREALKRTHPDGGGNSDAFHRVQRARQVLEGVR